MRVLPVLALILVSAFWGIHAVVGKTVEEQLGPFALTVLRFTFGALLYAPLLPRVWGLPRIMLRQLALTGLFWAVLFPFFFYQSLQFLTPVESVLLINTSPLIAALLGWLFLGERLRWTQGIGIAMAFSGVGWTVFGQWKTSTSVLGILFVLVAAVSFAAYTVWSRSLSRKLPLLDMVAATSICGAIELWIITLLSGHTREIWQSLIRLNAAGWAEFLYVVVIVSTVSYILYGYGLKRLPSAVSSALTFYPQVIFVALVQWIWLGIEPTWIVIFSAILILGGMFIMQLPVRKRNQLSPAG